MLRKFVRSVIIGLLAATFTLLVMPFFSQGQSFFQKGILSFKDAVRIASPAVVNVYSQSFSSMNNRTQVTSLGSGVIMAKEGYILTNKHVIQNADQIVVAMQNGQIFEASLIGSDSLTDLAVLKIRSDNLSTIPHTKRKLHVGDVVLAIGNPYNLGQSVSQGIVSALGRNAVGDYNGRQNFIQTDASINSGNSGGALINSLGELVGISTLSIGRSANEIAEGLNFAIPIDLANDVMNKIIRDGRVIRGFLGIQTDVLFNDGQGGKNKGIEITNVMENSPAAKAGLRSGDIMLQFGSVKAESPVQMMRVISNTKPNTTVDMIISRLGEIITLPVTIEEYTLN